MIAFYTALEVNNSAVSILGDETLKHIAQELLKTVSNSTTIDWTIKESLCIEAGIFEEYFGCTGTRQTYKKKPLKQF